MTSLPWMLLVLLLAFPLGGAEEDRFNDILKYFEAKDVNSRDSSLLRSDNKNGFSRSLEEQVFISGKQDQPRGGAKAQQQATPLAFASYYGSHMVLQQAPKSAGLWGYADTSQIGKPVQILLKNITGTVQKLEGRVSKSDVIPKALWSVQLKPVPVGGPYTITVQVENDTVSISDVLFGDVWLCSGQSNMEFTVSMLTKDNLLRELASVGFYPHVRLFTAELKSSEVPQYDLLAVRQPWSIASAESINGGDWKYFSAMCWLYGRRLASTRGYPIGLIATDWGGTRVEAWSSPEALKVCGASIKKKLILPWEYTILAGPNEKSVLWNAMIHPFLNMTIYGAIWYQGEANENSVNYNCTFPAMISDWRAKFHAGSGGQTDAMFPFGFVQLAPNRELDVLSGLALVRWQQTANVGYVPNSILPKVFMAVAMDLPDFHSPYSSIHPRDKETIADRLLLSGLSVAYGQKGLKFQGPLPSAFYVDIEPSGNGSMGIEFDNGQTPLEVRNLGGFEVCCLKSNVSWCRDNTMGPGSGWNPAPVIAHSGTIVTIQTCADSWIMGLRYAWRESPCPYKLCSVYSVENSLPVPPFIMNGIFGNSANPVRKWRNLK